jgi:hypothetical protein
MLVSSALELGSVPPAGVLKHAAAHLLGGLEGPFAGWVQVAGGGNGVGQQLDHEIE